MVAPFAVFGLVVDHAADAGVGPVLDLHFARVEVALEVCHVVLRIPQGELHERKQREIGWLRALVGHAHLPDFQRFIQRDEITHPGGDAVEGRADGRVAHPVPAGVVLQRAAHRLPRGGPVLAAGIVPQVDITPALVKGHVVIAVAGQAAQARVEVEGIAPGGIADNAKIVLRAEVVDPRQRGIRARDHILPAGVIKHAEFHEHHLPAWKPAGVQARP